MAQRRMFSLKITNSARFLRMPLDSQLLYFHLGLHADDDGVVEAYSVIKLTGSQEDNLKVLSSKGFVRVLNEDLVSYITDWNEHNLIRPDRKVDSVYKNLLLQMVDDVEIIEPKPRADTQKYTGRPVDNQMSAQVRLGKVRLGEVRLGKERLDKDTNTAETSSAMISSLIELFIEVNPACKNYYGNKTQRQACQDLIDTYTFEEVKNCIVNVLPKTNGRPYFPTIATPLQLRDKWVSLKGAVQKKKNDVVGIVY